MKKRLVILAGLLICFSAQTSIAKGKIVELVTDPWEPYYADTLDNQGYISEIVKEALNRSGYQANIRFIPFKRALNLVATGKKDAVMGAYYNDERAKTYAYSDPIESVDVVLFAKAGKGITYKTLEDLKPYRIGMMLGYSVSPAFDQADFLNKEEVSKLELNVKKLLHDRIDVLVDAKRVVQAFIRENMPEIVDKVEVIPPLTSNKLYVLFSKKIPEYQKLVADFNAGLKIIQQDGTLDRLGKKHGF